MLLVKICVFVDLITSFHSPRKICIETHKNGKNIIMNYGDKIYYQDENDEVANFKEYPIVIDENYKYVHRNPFYRLWAWFTYRFIATPYAFITFKLIKKVKFHNTKVLKKFKKQGYFIYANHTSTFCDGFCPGLICFPQKPHFLAHPSNVSIPFVGKFTRMWGALPLPDNIKTTKNFYQAIDYTLKNNNPIVIYPEAHVWPYYTKIRKFNSTSFRFPIKHKKPVFTFTTIYKANKIGKKPKIEIYVDGPFFPNEQLSEKDQQQALCDFVYTKLKERSMLSNYQYVEYIKKGENND